MSDHEIVWEFDRDCVRPKVVCNDESCQYRYECADGCEIIYDVEPHGDGYRHPAVEGSTGRVTLWHEMRKGTYCAFVMSMDDTGCVEELGTDINVQFEIGRIAVEPVWLGEDGVEWKRVFS